MQSAIILAGGRSARFGENKALLSLNRKTLVEHVYEKVTAIADQVIVAVASETHQKTYSRLLAECITVTDDKSFIGPLAGIKAALEIANGSSVAIVACDMPFVSVDLFMLFLKLCMEHEAVIPVWPNGHIEPLHSVYNSKSCVSATIRALEAGHRNVRAMISNLHNVLYVSTEYIWNLGIDRTVFMNINRRSDFLKAKRILAAHRRVGR